MSNTANDGGCVDIAHWEQHRRYKECMADGVRYMAIDRPSQAAASYKAALLQIEDVLGEDYCHIDAAVAHERMASAILAAEVGAARRAGVRTELLSKEVVDDAMSSRVRALSIRRRARGANAVDTLCAEATCYADAVTLNWRGDGAHYPAEELSKTVSKMLQRAAELEKAVSCRARAQSLSQGGRAAIASEPQLTQDLPGCTRLLQGALRALGILAARPQASRRRDAAVDPQQSTRRRAAVLRRLARVMRKRGESQRAIQPLREACEITQHALGVLDPDTASSMSALGSAHSVAGERNEAEPLLVRSVIARLWMCLHGQTRAVVPEAAAVVRPAAKTHAHHGVRRFSSVVDTVEAKRLTWLASLMARGGRGGHASDQLRTEAVSNVQHLLALEQLNVMHFADVHALLLHPIQFCCGQQPHTHQDLITGASALSRARGVLAKPRHEPRPWLVALATSLHNLGVHLKRFKHFKFALFALECALALREQEFGLEAMPTAQSLMVIATVLRALTTKRQSPLDSSHQARLADMCALGAAVVYEERGREQEQGRVLASRFEQVRRACRVVGAMSKRDDDEQSSDSDESEFSASGSGSDSQADVSAASASSAAEPDNQEGQSMTPQAAERASKSFALQLTPARRQQLQQNILQYVDTIARKHNLLSHTVAPHRSGAEAQRAKSGGASTSADVTSTDAGIDADATFVGNFIAQEKKRAKAMRAAAQQEIPRNAELANVSEIAIEESQAKVIVAPSLAESLPDTWGQWHRLYKDKVRNGRHIIDGTAGLHAGIPGYFWVTGKGVLPQEGRFIIRYRVNKLTDVEGSYDAIVGVASAAAAVERSESFKPAGCYNWMSHCSCEAAGREATHVCCDGHTYLVGNSGDDSSKFVAGAGGHELEAVEGCFIDVCVDQDASCIAFHCDCNSTDDLSDETHVGTIHNVHHKDLTPAASVCHTGSAVSLVSIVVCHCAESEVDPETLQCPCVMNDMDDDEEEDDANDDYCDYTE